MESLVSLKGVFAGYSPQKSVLRNIDFEVVPNDFIGIIGPNGGGKSTLLKVILGLLQPQKGSLHYKWGDNNLHHIGYLPQVNTIDKVFPIKVLDVVLSGLMGKKQFLSRYTHKDKNRAIELLDFVGLQNFATKPIGQLSGGQMQRVFLCRAIINNPALLILDEPNTYVDKHFEAELYELLNKLNEEMAILLVSHDIGTISSIVKTIACVNENLHYHKTNKISPELLKTYNCPIELITHGHVPHRVLHNH
ncbi:metal ABC transporter ATP-binding protein [Labilibacter sediminis]|nr:metal ABC transporter ATP-binding protein [Labilibacter sediminis]